MFLLDLDIWKKKYFCFSVGFIVNNVFYPLYWSCFDRNRLEVLYVWYHQNPPNSVFQSRVDRPSWIGKFKNLGILRIELIHSS